MDIKEILSKVVELDGTFRKINIFRHLEQVVTEFMARFERIAAANEFYRWVKPHYTSVERDLSPWQVKFRFKEKEKKEQAVNTETTTD